MTRPIIRSIIRPIIRGIKRSNSTQLFRSDLQNTLIAQRAFGSALPTYTRATTASVPDFEGIIHTALSGEARFKGARRVENLITDSQDFTNPAWVSSLSTITTGVEDPNGGSTAARVLATSANGLFYENGVTSIGTDGVNSLWIRRTVGTGSIRIYTGNSSSSVSMTTQITTEWQRITPEVVPITTVGRMGVRVVDSGDEVEIAFCQAEDVTGQANQNPSEYVSSAVGTGVEAFDGTFDTVGAGWTDNGDGTATAATATSNLDETTSSIVTGKSYTLTYTISGYSAGLVKGAFAGGGLDSYTNRSANGTYTETILVTGASVAVIRFTAGSGFTGTISGISIKEASHGANVDAVQNFKTLNGNTISSNVVTEATGALINSSTAQFGELAGVSGDYFSSPDSAAMQITGSLSLRFFGALADWSPATAQFLISRRASSVGTAEAYGLAAVGGNLTFTHNSASTQTQISSTINIAATDGTNHGVGFDWDESTGSVTFYESTDNITWTVLEVVSGPITAMNAGTRGLRIGGDWSNNFPLEGTVKTVKVYNGIDPETQTLAVAFNAGDYISGSTFPSSATGETWTINGNASIYQGYWDAKGPYGYMSEAAATNTNDESFDLTQWTQTGTAVSALDAVGIGGALNSATTLTDDNGAGFEKVAKTITIPDDSNTHALEIRIDKGSDAAFPLLNLGFTGGSTELFHGDLINLATGALTSRGASFADGTSSVVDAGVYWIYTIIMANNTSGNTSYFIEIFPAAATSPPTLSSAATGSCVIEHVQVELNSTFNSSPIVTNGSAVTRNADVLTYDDVGNISDLAGTAVCEASADWSVATGEAYLLSRDAAGRFLYVAPAEPSYRIRAYDGTNVSNAPDGANYNNSPQPMASTWREDLTAYSSGTLLPSVSGVAYDGTMGAGDIAVGCRNNGTSQWGGTNRLVEIFSNEKSAAEVLLLG